MIKTFSIKLVRAPVTSVGNDWKLKSNKWKVMIDGQTFDYYTGSALKNMPTVDDVLHCLISDIYSAEMTSAEFCAEFGYEPTPASKAIHKACIKNHEKLALTNINIAQERERLQDH